MNEGKNMTMIFIQELTKVLDGIGVDFFFIHRTASGKSLINLLVEFVPVGYNNKGKIAGHLPEYFLRKENHGVGLARPLCMPKDTESSLILVTGLDLFKCLIYAKKLEVSGNGLYSFAERIVE